MSDPITWSQTLLTNWVAGLANILPIGYAFGAGMISTVNPCGFAMLPAYLSLYIGITEPGFETRSPIARATRALYIGLMVTVGFLVLFSVVGLLVAAGGQLLVDIMPWAGLLTGVALAVLGVFLLAGKPVYFGFAARISATIDVRGIRGRDFLLFGIAYGVASLACTLPVFLVVVGSAIVADGILVGFMQFVSYALGMGSVLIVLTLGMAVFKGMALGKFRAVLPYVERVSAVLILLMGSYLVYYWLAKGGLLDRLA